MEIPFLWTFVDVGGVGLNGLDLNQEIVRSVVTNPGSISYPDSGLISRSNSSSSELKSTK